MTTGTHSPPSDSITRFLDSVHLAPRQSAKQLTVWPLVLEIDREGGAAPPYLPLAQALEEGWLHVDEVSDGGSVPHARVRNEGDQAVLVLFGEELIGAKQNRIPNATFLVPAKRELVIDVTCVEAGRWGRRQAGRWRKARGFERSASLVSHSLRRRMAKKVAGARKDGRGYVADQSEVWSEVASRLEFAGRSSPTSAYGDYVESRASDLAEIRAAFHPLERQVGFVAVIGSEVQGIEAIGRPDVFAASFERLLDAYAIDAVDYAAVVRRPRLVRGTAFSDPEGLLAALRQTSRDPAPSLGLGEDIRISGADVEGCALAAGDLVHLTASPLIQD